MTAAPTAKRASCQQCGKPAATCVCDQLVSLQNSVHVTIYRHPGETNKAVGTASLCKLALNSCTLIDTELVVLPAPTRSHRVLLFPPMVASTHSEDQLITTEQLCALANPADIELVVLDGSWKKARKMYYQSSDLHGLPKLQFSQSHSSNYSIRKAEKAGQYSTLEAVAFALTELEQAGASYQPLLNLQQHMINRQLHFMSSQVRQRY